MRWPVSLSTHVLGGTSPVSDGFIIVCANAAPPAPTIDNATAAHNVVTQMRLDLIIRLS
jgi:hypothetical protein